MATIGKEIAEVSSLDKVDIHTERQTDGHTYTQTHKQGDYNICKYLPGPGIKKT